LKPYFKQKLIDELTTIDMEDWIVSLTKELAPKSIRTIVGIVSSVMAKAALSRPPIIQANPLAPISLKKLLPKPKLKEEEDEDIDPFNADEIRNILAATLRVHQKALFQFAFASGLRTGELIALKWNHIDFNKGIIHVRDNIVTGENKMTVEKTTKTDERREVPLLPAAREALEWMKPITLLKNIGRKGYIFTPDGFSRWRDDRQIRSHWMTTLRRAKVGYRNPYQTRHTFASTLLLNGEPELLVAKLLGHATVEMIRRHYGKYIPQPNGIQLRSNYAELGGNSAGHFAGQNADDLGGISGVGNAS